MKKSQFLGRRVSNLFRASRRETLLSRLIYKLLLFGGTGRTGMCYPINHREMDDQAEEVEAAGEILLLKISAVYCVVIPANPMDIIFMLQLASCNIRLKSSYKSAKDCYWPISSLIYKHLSKKRKLNSLSEALLSVVKIFSEDMFGANAALNLPGLFSFLFCEMTLLSL